MTAPLRALARRSALTQWWVHLPIRSKGLLVVAIPVVALAATLVVRLPFTQQQQQTTALLARATETRSAAQELLIALQDVENRTHGLLLSRLGHAAPAADASVAVARIEKARHLLGPRTIALARLVDGEAEQQLVASAGAAAERAVDAAARLVSAAEAGRAADAPFVQVLLHDQHNAMTEVRAALDALRRLHDARVADSQTELARLRGRLTPLALGTFVGGLAGAVMAGWLFATGISRRVRALEANAERLARGERLRYAPSRGRDEIGSLDRALRRASLLLRTRDRELRSVNAALERTVHEQALLNRELEAFSYSVSHDLRAPLRSIDGFAQALREDWGDRLDEAAQDHLARVRNAAQRMGRLIDDLLKLSRLTRMQVQRSDVDLSRMAHEIARELEERNPARRVDWAIAPALHARCDPALARIMLENLLGNAWKFTARTPAARIEFEAMPETRPPVFVVRDNGAGFDMAHADKLFAPFQRLHAEREFPGSGIGLATVQRIIRKHGGEVTTRAEVGRGAAFYFTLEPSDGAVAA